MPAMPVRAAVTPARRHATPALPSVPRCCDSHHWRKCHRLSACYARRRAFFSEPASQPATPAPYAMPCASSDARATHAHARQTGGSRRQPAMFQSCQRCVQYSICAAARSASWRCRCAAATRERYARGAPGGSASAYSAARRRPARAAARLFMPSAQCGGVSEAPAAAAACRLSMLHACHACRPRPVTRLIAALYHTASHVAVVHYARRCSYRRQYSARAEGVDAYVARRSWWWQQVCVVEARGCHHGERYA